MNIFFRRANPRGDLTGAQIAVKAERSEPKGSLYSDQAAVKIAEGLAQEKKWK
jgi:hypothetical protein